MMLMFKVWNSTRDKKVFITLEEGDMLTLRLIAKASEKLTENGSILVLESDGTLIDEDVVLQELHRETFMLLDKNQNWSSMSACSVIANVGSTISTCSTESFVSCSDEETKRLSEETWQNFKLPLERMSETVIKECEKGCKDKQIINNFIQITVDAIRDLKKYAPAKGLKAIAKKIVVKFPKTFQDVDEDGVILGDGCHTIFCRLQDRNNYLNRPHKRRFLEQDLEISPKNKKKTLVSKAGCSNWQPEKHPDGEVPETLEEKRIKLNNLPSPLIIDADVDQMLRDTFAMQRFFINNPKAPSFYDIKDMWPILLQPAVIHWHYLKLMDQDIDNLRSVFNSKLNKILKFGITKKYFKQEETCGEESHMQWCALKTISLFFGENLDNLITNNMKQEDVENNSPLILIKNVNGNKTYTILFETQEVHTFEVFIEAIKTMFAIYYNFNLAYQKQTACTLEFVQRYVMKIHPDQGSKGKTKAKLKILSLLNKLKETD